MWHSIYGVYARWKEREHRVTEYQTEMYKMQACDDFEKVYRKWFDAAQCKWKIYGLKVTDDNIVCFGVYGTVDR